MDILKKILLLFASILIVLLLSEAGLQFINYPKKSWSPWESDPHTGFHYAPKLDQRMVSSEYDVSITTNEDGFRDDPIQIKQGPRIVLLGDSFTFGYGVDRPFIFADLLERQLGTEILNTASGGFDLIHQVQWLKHYGKKYSPDLIIYMLYLGNDLVGNWRWERKNGNIASSDRPTVRSHRDIKIVTLLKILRHRLFFRRVNQKWKLPDEYLALTAKNLSPTAQRDYEYSKTLTAELVEETKKINTPLLVVLIPYKTMVQSDDQAELANQIANFDLLYDLGQPNRTVAAWLHELKIPFLDLTPEMKKLPDTQTLYYQKDGHLTRNGHRAVAAILRNFLIHHSPQFTNLKARKL